MIAGFAFGFMPIAAAAFLAIRLRVYWVPAIRPVDDPDGFSLERYEPMARLLSSDDLDFLKAQRGYRREIGKKFRRERRKLIRLYLSDLAVDFRSLHAAARQMVASSGEENAELVGSLLRQQISFWRAITAIELRLLAGSVGCSADIRSLIDSMEVMRAEMSRLPPATNAA